MHHFAVDLLRKVRVQLLGESLQHFREALGCVEGLLLSNKSWWDTVDALAYQGMYVAPPRVPVKSLQFSTSSTFHDYPVHVCINSRWCSICQLRYLNPLK